MMVGMKPAPTQNAPSRKLDDLCLFAYALLCAVAGLQKRAFRGAPRGGCQRLAGDFAASAAGIVALGGAAFAAFIGALALAGLSAQGAQLRLLLRARASGCDSQLRRPARRRLRHQRGSKPSMRSARRFRCPVSALMDSNVFVRLHPSAKSPTPVGAGAAGSGRCGAH